VLNRDGSLNRAALAEIVFSDDAARRSLEAITHPAIRLLAEGRLARLREAGAGTIFYVARCCSRPAMHRCRRNLGGLPGPGDPAGPPDGAGLPGAGSGAQAHSIPDADGREEAAGRIVIDNRGTREELEAEVLRLWREEIGKDLPGKGDPDEKSPARSAGLLGYLW